MNKPFQIIKIVFGLMLIIACGIMLYRGLTGTEEIDSSGLKTYNKVIEDNINYVDMDWTSGSVRILKSNDDTIKLIEKTSGNKQRLSYDVNGDRLRIRQKASGFLIFNFSPKKTYLEVYLPEKQYSKLDFDFTSGGYEISDIKAVDINIDSTSGRIDMNNIVSDSLDVDITSGKFFFNGGAKNIDFSMTSGSGEISTSLVPERLDVNTTSGNAKVYIPDNNGFSVYLNKTSGKFNSDFPYTSNNKDFVYKNGGPKYNVEITSGSVNLLKN